MSLHEDWMDKARRGARQAAAKAEDNHKPTAPPATTAPQDVQEPNEAEVRTMKNIIAKPVEWLWRHTIPRGAITMLDGDPGLGKSTITTDVAARVSRGWAMPPGGGPNGSEPAGVLLLSAEDDAATTIRPRLEAAGADLGRVHILDAIRHGDDTAPPVLPWDLPVIEDTMTRLGVALLVIDPFLAFLDGDLDAHKDQDVRRCLHRLKEVAERTRAAIMLVRHLNKLTGGAAIYRGGGSIGITGAARSSLVVGRHPDNPSVCVLAGIKSNLGPLRRSITYSHEPAGDVSRIAWGGECDLAADDILGHG
jgi:hypothetical protein